MGITKKAAMIVPEVLADMVDAKIAAQLKLTPYAKVDNTLAGTTGDKVKYPSWNYIGDAADVAEGEEVGISEMSATTKEFTIKKAMKAVELSQESIDAGYGDPEGQAAAQVAMSIAGKVDTDVLETAYTAPMVVDKSAAVIGYDAIVDAVTKFEDEEDGVEKVMFIHPKQEATLLKDDDFVSKDKYTPDVAVNGYIGKIAGCIVKKSKKVKQVDAVTAVTGVYTITIGTKAYTGDKITINGLELVAGTDFSLSTDTAAGNAAALATALNASSNTGVTSYTWTSSDAVLTATEDSGKEGAGVPVVSVDKVATSGTLAVTVATTTKGVAASAAAYLCPIIKIDTDSEETEDTAPALTVFLKRDTRVDTEWKPRKQTTEIVAAKYYGVGLTNASKVVIAKFGK